MAHSDGWNCLAGLDTNPDLVTTVANMFFLPMGLVAKTFGFGADAAGVAALDVSGILYNLSAATLGNILGGPDS